MPKAELALLHRRPDEEPDFGDPDYEAHSDPYYEFRGMDADAEFDAAFPEDAKRIRRETEKKHPIDPTNINQDIRRNGGQKNYPEDLPHS